MWEGDWKPEVGRRLGGEKNQIRNYDEQVWGMILQEAVGRL